MVETADTSTQKEKTTEEEMEELYETSMRNLQEGNIIKGTVIEINGDSVIIEQGSEGRASYALEAAGRRHQILADDR